MWLRRGCGTGGERDAAGLTAPEAFVTADDITTGKPDPQPFQIAADLSQVVFTATEQGIRVRLR